MSANKWGRASVRLAACLMGIAILTGLAACGGSSSSTQANSSKGPILVGIDAAKTGPLAPFDAQPANALMMRLDEINQAGGVGGRQLQTKWIDTQSDKTVAASNADELINDGAAVVVTTCDFDYGSPAAFQAEAKNVPAISFCASSPKNATPSIIGKYGYSMGTGSDTEGVTAAEWLHKDHPDWNRVYVLKDTSLEYSKATADYFVARFKELGGQISGEDEFVGGPNTDISAQATRAKAAAGSSDAIYIGSWNPGASTAARQLRSAGITLPIIGNQSSDGQLTQQVAGNISNFYSLPLACIPSYCTGQGPNQAGVDKFASEYKAKYGEDLASSYPINGYDLGTVLQQAIDKAGSSDPAAIGQAIETMGPVQGLTSSFHFSTACHRPIGQSRTVMLWTSGQGHYQATVTPEDIPDIGDSNPCAGPQSGS